MDEYDTATRPKRKLPFHPDIPVGIAKNEHIEEPPYPHPWTEYPVLAFDIETTGVDVEQDRIVTYSLAFVGPDHSVDLQASGLVKPVGYEIPEGAAKVHGWTTERALQDPSAVNLTDALDDITFHMLYAERNDIPIVIYNAPFDATLLLREYERVNMPPPRPILEGPIIDPLVMDKWVDKYRKGKRWLSVTCEHYGVVLDDAHTAEADAVAAARLAYTLGVRFEVLRKLSARELHGHQQLQFKAQAEGLEKHLRKTKSDPHLNIDRNWPYRPYDQRSI